MATFTISIQKHQKRLDGKYPVSIRLTFKRKLTYLKTEYYVGDKQIDKDYNLKDRFLIRLLNQKIELYEDIIIKKLGKKVDLYSATELKEYLIKAAKLIFRCNCATCFGDIVPQKKDDFLAKFINYSESFSSLFFSLTRLLILFYGMSKPTGLK